MFKKTTRLIIISGLFWLVASSTAFGQSYKQLKAPNGCFSTVVPKGIKLVTDSLPDPRIEHFYHYREQITDSNEYIFAFIISFSNSETTALRRSSGKQLHYTTQLAGYKAQANPRTIKSTDNIKALIYAYIVELPKQDVTIQLQFIRTSDGPDQLTTEEAQIKELFERQLKFYNVKR